MRTFYLVMLGCSMDDLPMASFYREQEAVDYCERCLQDGQFFAERMEVANQSVGYDASTPICLYVLRANIGSTFERGFSYEVPQQEPWCRPAANTNT